METMNMTPAEKFIANYIKQQDNVFVPNAIVDTLVPNGYKPRKGLEKSIYSNGTLVNVVSDTYGHLPNEVFFGEVERQLKAANVNFVKKSINRDDRSFSVDYILFDDNLTVNVKNGNDKILPMLRFTNSYDSSCKTSGHFGFFRQVCSNGLHTSKIDIGFSVKHKGAIVEMVMPEISGIIAKFMENEYYSLANKFEQMAQTSIKDVEAFVKSVATDLNLFKFEKSDKNPEAGANARFVIDVITKEARTLGSEPNLWLGYNAFNELLHDKLSKTFDQQHNLDAKIFEHILELA